jgi:VanZ family protein
MATLVLGMAYAVFDEWHQSWVPGRTGSYVDVMLDMVGILLALGSIWWVTCRRIMPVGLQMVLIERPNNRTIEPSNAFE